MNSKSIWQDISDYIAEANKHVVKQIFFPGVVLPVAHLNRLLLPLSAEFYSVHM